MRSDMVVGGVPLNFDQPEGCVANVLSLTTPQDVCRLSAVSPIFKSAAESDVAWQRFLPNDLESILSTALDGSLLLSSASSKKEVYFSLCDNPIIVDHGRKSFSLEKKSGKICYVLSARDLVITWGDTPVYWKWKSNSDSRFAEVAKLIDVCRLEIIGKINTCLLSPATLYTAYLVFKFASRIDGLDNQPVDVTMKLDGGEYGARTCSWNAQGMRRRNTSVTVRGRVHYPKQRGDGWLEMELGDFFSKEKEDGELEMRFFDDTDHWKHGLIVEGIEIRPKDEVYFSLCDNPIIVDHGRKSFSLEKKSGKICYVLSARDLVITWGDTPMYWTWNSNSDSRFAEVAELLNVCRLEIIGKINTCLLSPATLYTAYLVFKFASRIYGLYNQPVDVTMKLDGGEYGARTVSWNARGMRRRNTSVTVRGRVHYPKQRGDGWLEMELGDFFSTEKEDGELEMRFFDDTDHWKRGLIVEGIEIRPKDVSRAASPSS